MINRGCKYKNWELSAFVFKSKSINDSSHIKTYNNILYYNGYIVKYNRSYREQPDNKVIQYI
jgi:hypothetical protein